MYFNKAIIILLLPIAFFVISLFILESYGVNWDTYQHLARGQTYFRYIFFGETDSKTLPNPCVVTNFEINQKKGRECDLSILPRISYYEKSDLDLAWVNQMTIGHPPLMDILLASSNQFFYKYLGWLDDITSYHVLLICISFALSLLIAVWSYQATGNTYASIISVISLYTVPLYFAEQHFNLKDPPVAFFITAAAYAIWRATKTKKIIWFVASGIFAGFGLGTKFNVIFLAFPIALWLPFALNEHRKQSFISLLLKKSTILMLCKLALIPILAWSIFWISYPAIWFSPIFGTMKVINYYKEISDVSLNPCYFPPLTGQWFWCSNIQTLLLLITTIPIITIILGSMGILAGFRKNNHENAVYLLWILLFIFPILRAFFPIVQLYGGSLRQIMEFIPPLSLLVGLGATSIIDSIYNNHLKKVAYYFIPLLFLPIIHTLIVMHPNQNIFINSLTGGYKGANQIGIPVIGNTYGNGYKQLIAWLNDYVPMNSKFTVLNAIGSAFPALYIRPDIQYVSDSLDITKQQGEYLLDVFVPGMEITNYFRYRYAKNILLPVYELKVNNIALGAIWHNSKDLLQPWARQSHQVNVRLKNVSSTIIDISIPQAGRLKEMKMYSTNHHCMASLNTGVLLIKNDSNNDWYRFTEPVSYFNSSVTNLDNERLYYFAGEVTNHLRLIVKPTECDLSTIQYNLWVYGTPEDDLITALQKPVGLNQ